jgi:hypothetical protein
VLPTITTFFLDLDSGLLTMFFSKAVLLSIAAPAALNLVSSTNASNYVSVNLAGALLLNTTVSQQLILSLGNGSFPTVIDLIHMTKVVGSSQTSTFLSATYGFIGDTGAPRNYMAAIPVTEAVPALFVRQDVTAPRLKLFDLNMNTRLLTLTFDSAVNGSNVVVKFITLHAHNDQPLDSRTASYVLTDSTPFGYGRIAYVNISSNDFNSIMMLSPQLAMTASNTYLTLNRFAYRDISYNANPIVDILTQNAVQVSHFTPDLSPPTLLYYDVSEQDGYVNFYFNKIILCSSFRVTAITFQAQRFIGTTLLTVYLNVL